jgi:osmotically inducible lipoprotein OsmB
MNRKRTTTLGTLAALALSTALLGCGSTSDQTKSTAIGAALGGAAGHVLSGGDTGATLGGAAAGGYIGHEREERKR